MKRAMKLIPVAVLALVSYSALPGCETLTETAGQNGNKIRRTFEINSLLVVDDVEMLALIDRPSWLSRKPMPDY